MLVDIATIREMVQTNEIQITWMEKEKQLSNESWIIIQNHRGYTKLSKND